MESDRLGFYHLAAARSWGHLTEGSQSLSYLCPEIRIEMFLRWGRGAAERSKLGDQGYRALPTASAQEMPAAVIILVTIPTTLKNVHIIHANIHMVSKIEVMSFYNLLLLTTYQKCFFT